MRIFSLCLLCILLCTALAQDKKKDYKELDKDALAAFKDGMYEEAYKIWKYIHNDYPRGKVGNFNDWVVAFNTSIVREGVAKKQMLLQSTDAKERATAESAYTDAVDLAKQMLASESIVGNQAKKILEAAEKPLLEALKKKEEKKEDKK